MFRGLSPGKFGKINLTLLKHNLSFFVLFQASIDYSNIQPKHLLGHKTNLNVLGQERFKEIVLENTEPLTTERYPGYKRGIKSFNDECGVPGAGTKT